MLGAALLGRGARDRALVGDVRALEADREAEHRHVGVLGHVGQHQRRVDAARQEQAVGHVGPAVHAHRVGECCVDGVEGGVLVLRQRPADRQRKAAPALDDAAVDHRDGLARQHALDALEHGVAAGGEAQLQELVAGRCVQRPRRQPGADQRARLGGEREAVVALDVVQRLDAERVARQHEPAVGRIVQRDRVHAAQALGEVEPVGAEQMQRRLAVRLRGERDLGHRRAQLDVVVDLAVGDQRGAAGLEQRLVAGHQIDDRQPGLHQPDARLGVMAAPVGPAMAQPVGQIVQQAAQRRRCDARALHHAGDAAHQDATRLKNSRYCRTTALSVNAAS